MMLPSFRRRILCTTRVVCLSVTVSVCGPVFGSLCGSVHLNSAEASLTPFTEFKRLSKVPTATLANGLGNPHHEAGKIRIRLSEAAEVVHIRGYDVRIFSGTETENRRPALASDRVGEWDFECSGRGVTARNRQTRQARVFNGPISLESPAGFVSFNQRPYREKIRIYPVQQGRMRKGACEVVNQVDIEKYLEGLVNAEFSSKWSEEAVAAQVIAARTYALHQINQARKRPGSHYDVDSTTKDQVYDGSYREDFRASRSVNRTRGMILKSSLASQNPIKAFYHSTCGGMTELPSQVWGGEHPGFKRSVKCPYCAGSPKAQWSLNFQATQLSVLLVKGLEALGAAGLKALPLRGVLPSDWKNYLTQGQLVGFQTLSLDDSGRARLIHASWQWRGKTLDLPIPAVKVRDWLGNTQMKSTAVQITPGYDGDLKGLQSFPISWKLEGRGNGHGVGLCQWGAKTMGEKGFKTADILKHYYPDAVTARAW